MAVVLIRPEPKSNIISGSYQDFHTKKYINSEIQIKLNTYNSRSSDQYRLILLILKIRNWLTDVVYDQTINAFPVRPIDTLTSPAY